MVNAMTLLLTPAPAPRTPAARPIPRAAPTTTRESEVRSYCRRFDTTFTTAAGSEMVDESGRRYIDFLAGCSALNYGHNDPDMADALVAYVRSGGVTHGLDMATSAKTQFIDDFVELILEPRGLPYRVQFTGPTGANAVEAALKLARKVTGRTEVIAFTNGFHGVTMGALAATGNQRHRMGPSVVLNGVSRALFDGYLGSDVCTAQLLDSLLSDPSSGYDAPAAILLETVQGEGGLNTASTVWLQRIAEVARRHGALLIVDDIQAGCGRTGSFFSFEEAGIVPDIVTLSKSLSGFGLPMSLVLMHPDHDQWLPGEHNGTFRGNNLAFVTASVALRKFWSDHRLTDAVHRKSALIRATLERLAALTGGTIKGRGMLLGLELASGTLADSICDRCFDDGLIVETSGPRGEVVKVLAPLTTADVLLAEGLAILEAAMHGERYVAASA